MSVCEAGQHDQNQVCIDAVVGLCPEVLSKHCGRRLVICGGIMFISTEEKMVAAMMFSGLVGNANKERLWPTIENL